MDGQNRVRSFVVMIHVWSDIHPRLPNTCVTEAMSVMTKAYTALEGFQSLSSRFRLADAPFSLHLYVVSKVLDQNAPRASPESRTSNSPPAAGRAEHLLVIWLRRLNCHVYPGDVAHVAPFRPKRI